MTGRIKLVSRARLLPALICAALCGLQGCGESRLTRRDSEMRPAWRSSFPTVGSDLQAAPRGVTIPATSPGIDLVKGGGLRGKIAKMTDDAIDQVKLPGFATIR